MDDDFLDEYRWWNTWLWLTKDLPTAQRILCPKLTPSSVRVDDFYILLAEVLDE